MTTNAKTKSRIGNAFALKKKNKKGSFFLLPMSVFLLTLFFRNAEIAAKAISAGIRLCVQTLIPSLFPFMIVSELLVSGGLLQTLGTRLARPMQRMFGMGGDAAGAVLLGMLCGFPIGTRCALSLYRQGRLDEREFARVLAFSNHPSAAFLIHTVGRSIFGSQRLGVLLYLTTLLSSILLQLLLRGKPKNAPLSPMPRLRKPRPTLSEALTSAVSGSAQALLSVCAFVVFFSAVSELLAYLSEGLRLPSSVGALLFGIFELTGGTAHAAECAPAVAPYLCAFSVGWGGLSVHCQLLYLCAEESVSLRSYFLTKSTHGLLNVLLLALAKLLFS